jgi:hypothetical protein
MLYQNRCLLGRVIRLVGAGDAASETVSGVATPGDSFSVPAAAPAPHMRHGFTVRL